MEVVPGAWLESNFFSKSSGSLLRGVVLIAERRCSSIPDSARKGPNGGGRGGATTTGTGMIPVNIGVLLVAGPETGAEGRRVRARIGTAGVGEEEEEEEEASASVVIVAGAGAAIHEVGCTSNLTIAFAPVAAVLAATAAEG